VTGDIALITQITQITTSKVARSACSLTHSEIQVLIFILQK
jgi:hypothetical protein